MNDIFLSYASPDRAVAHELADALEALGWSVWWDREIPYGKPFDQVIEEELNASRCVVVLWTAESVDSRWVKTEASAAADRDRLIPVLLERVAIPFEFRRIQTAELYDWSGDRTHPEFIRVVDSVKRMLGEPAAPQNRSTKARQAVSRFFPPAWTKTAAAAVLVLLVVFGWWFMREPGVAEPGRGSAARQESEAADTKSAGSVSVPQASSPAPSVQKPPVGRAASSAASDNVSQAGPWGIRIGDKIDDGVPQPGAGFIDSPGDKDVYTFTASARQRVYFRRLGFARGLELIEWKLTDPDGRTVFDVRFGHSEPGVQLLRKAGGYRMTVGSDQVQATGAYAIQLVDVPAPQQFSVKIGEVIAENVPATGAGRIASPGARSVYAFEATAGQRVYFRYFEFARGLELIESRLTDEDGADVFNGRLGHTEPGTQVLRRGGKYKLEIGSDQVPATGDYRMQLLDVEAPQKFAVKIGDTIRENVPTAGAGLIERPGSRDVYVFTAEPGQRVYFRKLEHARGMELIEWRLTDGDGTQVFNARLGHGDPGVHVLRKGGTYTLEVGSDNNPAAGSYRIALTNAAAE